MKGWIAVLGTLSVLLLVSGFVEASRRISRYRREARRIRARAMAEMAALAARGDGEGDEDGPAGG